MDSAYLRNRQQFGDAHGFEQVDKFLRNTRHTPLVTNLERPVRGGWNRGGSFPYDEPPPTFTRSPVPPPRFTRHEMYENRRETEMAPPPTKEYLYDNVNERAFTLPTRDREQQEQWSSPTKSVPTSPDRGRSEPCSPQFSRNDKKRKSTLSKFRSFLKKYLRINNNAPAPSGPTSTFYGQSKLSASSNSISGTVGRNTNRNTSMVRVKSFSGSSGRSPAANNNRERRDNFRDLQLRGYHQSESARNVEVERIQPHTERFPTHSVRENAQSAARRLPYEMERVDLNDRIPPNRPTLSFSVDRYHEREPVMTNHREDFPPIDYPTDSTLITPVPSRKPSQSTMASKNDIPVVRTNSLKTPCLNGIVNRGNVCYMSASLQCLACTGPFAEYFVCEKFIRALKNRTAKSDVSITRALADVLQCLWLNAQVDDTCENFFRSVNRIAPQYPMNCQQDAQEFLGWLLNQIHDEIKDIPSTSDQSSTSFKWQSKSEEELANDDFRRHTNGNSAIVDFFNAQFRHCIECTHCGFRRLTFDPYMMIQLALRPDSSSRVSPPELGTVVFITQEKPRRLLRFKFQDKRTIRELKELIYANFGVAPERVVIYLNSIDGRCMTLHASEPIGRDIALTAVELPRLDVNEQRSDQMPATATFAVGNGAAARRFGYPFVVLLNRQWTYQKLSVAILDSASFMLTTVNPPSYSDFRILVQDTQHSVVPLDPAVTVPLYHENITHSLTDWNSKALKIIVEWKETAVGRCLVTQPEHVEDVSIHSQSELSASGSEYNTVTLDKLLNQEYGKSEQLTDWQCTQCKRTSASSTVKFHSMPPILVFHLKPFEMLDDHVTTKRVETAMEIPLESLDMTPYVYRSGDTLKRRRPNEVQERNRQASDGPFVYDLVGVVHHFGERINSGHYTATTRNPIDGQWRKFDDKLVTLTDKNTIRCTASAYLLFYERRSTGVGTVRSTPRWFPDLIPEHVKTRLLPKQTDSTSSHPPAQQTTTVFGHNSIALKPQAAINGPSMPQVNGNYESSWRSPPSRSRSAQSISTWRGTPPVHGPLNTGMKEVYVSSNGNANGGRGGYW